MAEKLLQHKHCMICGKAIPLDEEYCSPECKGVMQTKVKKRRTTWYLYLLLFAALIMVMLFL